MDTPAAARTRIWALLVLLLAAVLTLTGTAGTASAASGSTNENCVKALGAETINAVGVGGHISAGQRRDEAAPQPQVAQGRGVHTYYVMPAGADGTTTGNAVLVHNAGPCRITSADVMKDPDALTGLTPSQIDDLARNAGYEVAPGKAGASNPATRYYMPGTKKSQGVRVLPEGVSGQEGVKGGPYAKFVGGPHNGRRVELEPE